MNWFGSQRSALTSGLPQARRGFSLIEVLAAVAIFAIGMVAVLGLFAPVTRSVAAVGDAEAAARAADSVRARLQALAAADFSRALTYIQEVADLRKKDANGAYNPNDGTHPEVIFGKLSGDVGFYNAANGHKRWEDATVPTPQAVADADKFFEIDLVRNDTVSPKTGDATAAVVAYTMRIRWPAFIAIPGGAATQVGSATGGSIAIDHGKKQALYFSGSILR